MTAQCGGGTSGPKAGGVLDAALTVGNVAGLFSLEAIPWLIPALALLDIGSFTLTSFCATDPPAMPAFTTGEINALLKVSLGADFASGLAKMPALIANVVWNNYCQCTSGALVPFVYPTQPTGTGTYTPPVPLVAVACRTLGPFPHTVTTGQIFNRGGPLLNDLPSSYVRVTTTTSVVTSPAPPITYNHQFQDSSGANTIVHSYTAPVPSVVTQIYIVPNDGITTSLQTKITAGAGAGSTSEQTLWEVFCDGQFPSSVASPCCPPDPATQASLDLILNMVTLLQRQLAPFAYVVGTAHAGLSGTGTIAVNGLLGVKVEITTDPTSLGREGTTPPMLFDRGFLSWGVPDGYPSTERLARTPQVSMPARCSAYTSISYDLHPGVVVTITELKREP